jgi:hypothetical protein
MPTHRDWSRVRAADRKRKVVQVTLSDEARLRLAELAQEHPDGTQSAVVEDLVLGRAR